MTKIRDASVKYTTGNLTTYKATTWIPLDEDVATDSIAVSVETLTTYLQSLFVPFTTKGDLLGFSTSIGVLGIGTNDYVLTADSGTTYGYSWKVAAAGVTQLINKGELLGYTGAALGALGAPTTGQVLLGDTGEALGIKWGAVSGTGDVVGVASSVTDNIVTFSDTSGKAVKDSGTGIATVTGHIASTSNPHSVDSTDVGAGNALWNASKLMGKAITATTATDGKILVYRTSTWVLEDKPAGGTGHDAATTTGEDYISIAGGTQVIDATKIAVAHLDSSSGTPSSATYFRGDGTWSTPETGTTYTVANEDTDTTCFMLFNSDATGTLGPKTNSGLTFNSNTATLNVTNITATDITADTIGTAGNTIAGINVTSGNDPGHVHTNLTTGTDPGHVHTLASGTTGTLQVGRGGTGAITFTANAVLIGNTTSAITATSNLTYSASILSVTGEIRATGDIIAYY